MKSKIKIQIKVSYWIALVALSSCILLNAKSIFAQLPDKLPDLIITNVTWEPADPQVGDSVWFIAEVHNIGEGPTPADKTHGVKFMVDGGAFGWNADQKSSMQPGDIFYASPDPTSNEAGGYWIIGAPGEYEISVEIDDYCIPTQGPSGTSYCTENIDPKCENRICESNEKNNIYYITFVIEGTFVYEKKPDLIITDVSMVPEDPVPGDDVVFSAIVKNQGDTAAASQTGYFGVNFMLGETRVTRTAFDAMITNLEPGESKKLTANWSLPEAGSTNGAWKAVAGDTIVTALVDKDNGVIESIETNNAFSKTLYINVHDSIKTADLIVGDIFFDPPDPLPYQMVFMSANIVNQGPVYTKPSDKDHTIKTDFFLSGINVSRTIHEQSLTDSLPAGDTVKVYGNQVDHNLELDGGWYSKNPGDYIFTSVTDSWTNDIAGHIKERDNNNNRFQKRLAIMSWKDSGPLPDLEVTDLSWDPAEPMPGDSITFTATIENIGNLAILGNRLYKSRITVFDTTIFARSASSMGIGESADMHFNKIKIPHVISDNVVKIAVDTFPWFSINEITKTNNILSKEISSLETSISIYTTVSFIKIYPNPATTILYIDYKTDKDEILYIRVINLTGQIVLNDTRFVIPGLNQVVLSANDIIDGLYFINVMTNEKSICVKTIIKH